MSTDKELKQASIPEGFCLDPGHRRWAEQTGEKCSCPKYVRHPDCTRHEHRAHLPERNPWDSKQASILNHTPASGASDKATPERQSPPPELVERLAVALDNIRESYNVGLGGEALEEYRKWTEGDQ